MKPVQRVLDDADLQKNQVDEIVLVGGSTRILKIQQLVKDFFGGKVSVLMLYAVLLVCVTIFMIVMQCVFNFSNAGFICLCITNQPAT